jgi:hypothetical protein
MACGAGDALDLLGMLNAIREPMEWAAVANVVFETADADATAQSVVLRAGSALSELVNSVRVVLGIEGPVVMAGGLLRNQPKLEGAVRVKLGSQCIRLDEPPVAGAVRLAELELSA